MSNFVETDKISRRDFLKMASFVTAATVLSPIDEVFAEDEAFRMVPQININDTITKQATSCWIGKQDCGMFAWKVNGKVIKLEGDINDPRTGGALCPKGQSQITTLYDPYRVKAPLKRTNAKGITGQWEEISWDQANTEIAARLNEIKSDDIYRFVFQKGRAKAAEWHYDSFNSAFGTKNKQGHGATCSDAGYRATELIFDGHGCNEVDLVNCEYLITWGWNITRSGGPHLCQIGWPQQFIDAKKRGMRVIALDPQIRSGLQFVDDWVQVKPGYDMAFFLAMANVLVANNTIDEEYLKKHTNAPFLVGSDGIILTQGEGDNKKELVWDSASNTAKPFDEVSDPPLTGTFTVDGAEVKPAFQLYKEHIAQYTPTWAEPICGVPASKITEIATEFGQKARIGQTITVEGKTLPHRPVAIGYYHVVQQELGAPTAYALNHCTMLVGAVDVYGSTRPRNGSKTARDKSHRDKWVGYANDPSKIKDQPDGPSLDGSKFFPIGSGGYTLAPYALANPTKYNLKYTAEQLAMWFHHANPVMAAPNQDTTKSSYSKLGFVVVVDPMLSETADLCADYVLPAATLDKYEGPLGGHDGYQTLKSLRTGVMDPLFSSKPDAEIYIDVAEKLGVLDKYIDALNGKLKLPDNLKLDTSKKPNLVEALDIWAQSQGKTLDWFKQNGVKVSEMSVDKRYAYLWDPAYGGLRHEFYSDVLVRIGNEVKKRGVNAPYVADYNSFPAWRTPTMASSPAAYDLTLISFKKMEHKQSRTANNILLNMLDPESPAIISTQTAQSKGISDGDSIEVESHNALTGETKKLIARAQVIDGIMPGVIGIAHHHGQFSHPIAKERDLGVTSNKLFPVGEGYVDLTGNQSFLVKVKVTKK